MVKRTEVRQWRVARLPIGLLRSGALMLVLAAAIGLSACDSGRTTTNNNSTPLAQLSWCDRPILDFQDSGTTNQATISQWDKVHDQLGFTTYLPESLPKGSCLVLAGGTIHDPIYGGHLSITYDLPSAGPVSFSEAPKRANIEGTLQCTQDAQNKTTTVCLGTIGSTSVTIASRQPPADVQKLFHNLKADVAWVPQHTDQLLATPTATTTGG